MHQPLGFRNSAHPNYVCLLRKSLYGLKQSPPAWYQRFVGFITTIGFRNSIFDNSLFVYSHVSDLAYFLLYVDDIILIALSDSLHQSIMSKLSLEFSMKDLGPLSYFLGIAVTRTFIGLFLSQRKYATKILEKAGVSDCNHASTPVAMTSKLSTDSGSP